MAKIHWALACLLLFVTAAAAQEHYTEGPVWRVTLVRVKPAQMDAYLTSLRQATKPLLEEEKRTGVIVDYKIFLATRPKAYSSMLRGLIHPIRTLA